MPVLVLGIVEDVEAYEGKNGYGCNIVISTKIDKKVKRLELRTKDQKQAELLESKLEEEVTLKVELVQNNFGLRLGDILEIA